MSLSHLEYVIRHVFLPPKLPQSDDTDPANDASLTKAVHDALVAFLAHVPADERQVWNTCVETTSNMLEMRNSSNGLVEDKVAEALNGLFEGGIIGLHIRGQNAGIIVERAPHQHIFQLFELSSTNEAVFSTAGRLRRRFPGPALEVSSERVANPHFRRALAELLARLDIETPEEVAPKARKARTTTAEVRNTPHPMLVTEMLGGMLRALGQPRNDVTRIVKRVREDVLWKDTLRPWRRSPLWLFLRVALQLRLRQGDEVLSGQQHKRYKFFMVFFMALLAESALRESLPSELLFVMTAKIARRVLKLGTAVAKTQWLQHVRSIVQKIQTEQARRWQSLQRESVLAGSNSESSDLTCLRFQDDTALSLVTLQPYLSNARTRPSQSSHGINFSPVCPARISQSSSELPRLSWGSSSSDDDARVAHADVELWVASQLDDWLLMNLEGQETCASLATLVDAYVDFARVAYSGNPEELSLMFLTAMELWVALDKCASHHYPLLADYHPGFASSLLEPLLLPRKQQMERLQRVEQHLAKRISSARHPSHSLFDTAITKQSFAVQYFHMSPDHQKLRRTIETEATATRTAKQKEFRRLEDKYQDLMRRSEAMSCEYVKRRKGGHAHSWQCQKCALKDEAEGLRISVHEWPLPNNDLQAKAAVFELKVPPMVAHIRDTTYKLLTGIFATSSSSRSSGAAPYMLRTYSGLSTYVHHSSERLQLGSSTKPFVVAHYERQSLQFATLSSICVNNGMTYGLYDNSTSAPTLALKDLLGNDIRNTCTPKLPASSIYQSLQYAVGNTTHNSNAVIARQQECPTALTLHEYYAFATLRAGHRLQWRNLARELAARGLNFSCEETHTLAVQAAWQAGPAGGGTGGGKGPSSACRDSHADLEEEGFTLSLLAVQHGELRGIEANWQGAMALRTYVALAARVLSLTPFDTVRAACISFLRRAQRVAQQWMRDLLQTLQSGNGGSSSSSSSSSSSIGKQRSEKELHDLRLRALEMALTSHGVLDVDRHHLPALVHSSDDVAIATECAIVVHDCTPPVVDHLPAHLRLLLRRHWRRSHQLEPVLRAQVLALPLGLDAAVRRMWGAYRPGRPWAALPAPYERWLETETVGHEGGFVAMPVHYNVLNGSLLVNGVPLSRLPSSYESHTTYRRILGERVIDVVPSTMDDMLFEMGHELDGNRVYFRMHDKELIIRTRRGTTVYELLPLHALKGDFPDEFIEAYAHWLDLDTGSVEWRPLADPWVPSAENWRMQHDEVASIYVLAQGERRLIDIRSPTTHAISSILGRVEHTAKTHITLDRATQALQASVPRLKLDFFVDGRSGYRGHRRLASKQFRDMVVDENQSIFALTGLVNKLVLRSTNTAARSVIVPYGTVSCARGDNEGLKVHIGLPANAHLTYHLYHVDTQLGRLVDNGSMTSRLFRSYLHAVTAHCLPDDLTGRTGTEEALHILGEAATRSFLELAPADVHLLELLARLTPERVFYPEYLQQMQKVHWHSQLSPLAQHTAFATRVAAIFEQARCLELFRNQSTGSSSSSGSSASTAAADVVVFPDVRRGSPLLQRRAAIREAAFRTAGFGAEAHTAAHDATYAPRDAADNNMREHATYVMAKLVDARSTNLDVSGQLLSEIESWKAAIAGEGTDEVGHATAGRDIPSPFSLRYAPEWFEKQPAEVLPGTWCALQRTLSSTNADTDQYRLLIFLSTMAYSQHAKPQLVQTLLAFATHPALRALRPPRPLAGGEPSSFQLQHGYKPDAAKLEKVIIEYARDFDSCPEANLTRRSHESEREADRRREREHEHNLEAAVDAFVKELVGQWPTATVRTPSSGHISIYIDITPALAAAQRWFTIWHDNQQFQRYIHRAQSILSTLRPAPSPSVGRYSFVEPEDSGYRPVQGFVDIAVLMAQPAPGPTATPPDLSGSWIDDAQPAGEHMGHRELEALISDLAIAFPGGYEQRYIDDLRKSFAALAENTTPELRVPLDTLRPHLEAHLSTCQSHLDAAKRALCDAFAAGQPTSALIARDAQIWPRQSPTALLQLLATNNAAVVADSLRDEWKDALIAYGLALCSVQRARRMLDASAGAGASSAADLAAELHNRGHENWHPRQRPDWLLLEIENNLLIRPIQARIAREMIAPTAGAGDAVMQLNMGEGKSSVIVPIVATALANDAYQQQQEHEHERDRRQLVRVVVLKPLMPQMAQLLAQKLGGLLGRRVMRMPVSRALRLDVAGARHLRAMYEECMRDGGVLLVQPEHLLSFELLGFDHLLASSPSAAAAAAAASPPSPATHVAVSTWEQQRAELGRVMLNTQRWLDQHARDILDESDEILSVRFELVYTMGVQRDVELGAVRWAITQHVLSLVSRFAETVRSRFPQGLEVQHQGGGEESAAAATTADNGCFPHIRILQSPAGDELLDMVAREVCAAGLPGVPVWKFRPHERALLFRFLTHETLSDADVAAVQQHLPALSIAPTTSSSTMTAQSDGDNIKKEDDVKTDQKPIPADTDNAYMRQCLLLLRGLFAGGVLRFALARKRWRVHYGPDSSRTLLAVPFRAKDSPAARAEFGHPDVTVALTCLSYYYAGLTDAQLRVAFGRLRQDASGGGGGDGSSGAADVEYASWARAAGASLPAAHRRLAGVNLSDASQCERDVFPALRRVKHVVDFYLARVVFPAEMKEFAEKLAASGWDLVRGRGSQFRVGEAGGVEKRGQHPAAATTVQRADTKVTGFSGTNDSRYILPLPISQCDLPEQLHTNARVLAYLLRPENTYRHVLRSGGTEAGSNSECGGGSGNGDGESLTADQLLRIVVGEKERPVRVIIDVGAQVLELSNRQVAAAWLALLPAAADVSAAVFFDERNELAVLNLSGQVQPLRTSPFATQMDACLVYLDEVHTRGTDLRLPRDYRAAVTLGPGLTKDRLVQACMRMRKLGKGQSVMFCGPAEVERKILELRGKVTTKATSAVAAEATTERDGSAIEVIDVLKWSISETFAHTRQCMPLWAMQGLRFIRHQGAWSAAAVAVAPPLSDKVQSVTTAKTSSRYDMTEAEFPLDIAETLLEPEAQSIEDRYGSFLARGDSGQAGSASEQLIFGENDAGRHVAEVKYEGVDAGSGSSSSKSTGHTDAHKRRAAEERAHDDDSGGNALLHAIRARCREFQLTSLASAALHEEQERELTPEHEREQQVERPPAMTPYAHAVHAAVQRLCETGRLDTSALASALAASGAVVVPKAAAFLPAFSTLAHTSAAAAHLAPGGAPGPWPLPGPASRELLVTADFARTVVEAYARRENDRYLRPVHWVLSFDVDIDKTGVRGAGAGGGGGGGGGKGSKRPKAPPKQLLILSPFEVQQLLPAIRQHRRVRLHVYAPRVNISAPTFEHLIFCAIPPVVVDHSASTQKPDSPFDGRMPAPHSSPLLSAVQQLNLFAGQLYLADYAAYVRLCQFLGVCYRPLRSASAIRDSGAKVGGSGKSSSSKRTGESESEGEDERQVEVASDGFVAPGSSRAAYDPAMAASCPFTRSPVALLRALFTMRRKGLSFAESHIGAVLGGELLSAEEHFGARG